MKRWNVELSDHTLKLYYKNLDTAKMKNPKAISITECLDYDYLNYIEKIISSSIETLYNCRGRLVYKIPHNSAFVLVQIWYDLIDEELFYYDGLQFQIHDKHMYSTPITWDIGSPKDFCLRFLDDEHTSLPIEIISLNDLKKLKPLKFWFRNLKAYYKDDNGYFYLIHKYDLPNKKACEEYKRFKDNKNALLVGIGKGSVIEHIEWFDSEEHFQDKYEQYKLTIPASHSTPFYRVKKVGYAKKAPDDRKIVFRLPYFRLDSELNHEPSLHIVARKWCSMMEGYKQFGEPLDNIDWVEDLIRRWVRYSSVKGGIRNGHKSNSGS